MQNLSQFHDGIQAYSLERQKILRNYFSDLSKIVTDGPLTFAFTELLRSHGLHRTDILEGSERISFKFYYHLLQEAQNTAYISGLGLLIGAMKIPTDFGVYGYAMQSSETFSDFAAVVKRIFGAIYEGLECHVRTQQGFVVFRYVATRSVQAGYIPLMEQVVSTGVALISRLINSNELNWRLCEARFAFERPPYAELYDKYIPCKLHFNQQYTELCIPEYLLGSPIKSGNHLVTEMCEHQFKMMLDTQNSSIGMTDRVRSFIYSCSNDIPPLGEIAERCCVSERTLRLHLAEEGTSFRDLVNEIRIELAKKYLIDGSLSVKEVAYRLGYSKPQSFCRAFSKSVGSRPKDFREGK